MIQTQASISVLLETSSPSILYPAYNLNIYKHTSQFRYSLTLRLAITRQYVNIRSRFEIILKSISQYVLEKSIPIELNQRFFVVDFIQQCRFFLILLSLVSSPLIVSFTHCSYWSLYDLLFFYSFRANSTVSYLWSWDVRVICCVGLEKFFGHYWWTFMKLFVFNYLFHRG